MLRPTTLKAMIYSVVAAFKATLLYGMTSFSVACVLPLLVAILILSSTVCGVRIVYPPFDSPRSLLSLAFDSSLAPPYDLSSDLDTEEESGNEKKLCPTTVSGADTVHFCFLVHGFQGYSGDLSYFETVLKHRACVEKKHYSRGQRNQFGQDKYEMDDEFVIVPTDSDGNDGSDFGSSKTQDFVVHNSVCNGGKTKDGLIKGGDRLVAEMRELIDSKMKERYSELNDGTDDTETVVIDEQYKSNDEDESNHTTTFRSKEQTMTPEKRLYDITISVIGNSMGGLYGRYAIAKLIDRHCVAETAPTKDGREREEEQGRKSPASWILEGKYRLRLDTFCTTACPHFGVSQHTWIRIPRIAEIGIAATMGETGRDLFRLNDLVYTMSTDSTFLDPLASFRKRIAYANCYRTDFPVPVGTAAFLSHESTYPHEVLNNFKVEDECDLVTATLRTETNAGVIDDQNELFDEVHQMSVSLDRLGWTKVFVDLQREMFSIHLLRPTWLQRSQASERLQTNEREEDDYGACSSGESSRLTESTNLRGLKRRKVVSSKEIANVVNEKHENTADDKPLTSLRMPAGHNMIVAFSRNRLAAFLNKGGRPFVDALAKELVHDVFDFHKEEAKVEDPLTP